MRKMKMIVFSSSRLYKYYSIIRFCFQIFLTWYIHIFIYIYMHIYKHIQIHILCMHIYVYKYIIKGQVDIRSNKFYIYEIITSSFIGILIILNYCLNTYIQLNIIFKLLLLRTVKFFKLFSIFKIVGTIFETLILLAPFFI